MGAVPGLLPQQIIQGKGPRPLPSAQFPSPLFPGVLQVPVFSSTCIILDPYKLPSSAWVVLLWHPFFYQIT